MQITTNANGGTTTTIRDWTYVSHWASGTIATHVDGRQLTFPSYQAAVDATQDHTPAAGVFTIASSRPGRALSVRRYTKSFTG